VLVATIAAAEGRAASPQDLHDPLVVDDHQAFQAFTFWCEK